MELNAWILLGVKWFYNFSQKAGVHMEIIIQLCKDKLQSHYQDHFVDLILYGSTVTHTASVDSDIDLLVLLKKPFDYFVEFRQITDLLYPIQLESERFISARPADVEEFEQGTIQLYRNARREGVVF